MLLVGFPLLETDWHGGFEIWISQHMSHQGDVCELQIATFPSLYLELACAHSRSRDHEACNRDVPFFDIETLDLSMTKLN
jgi:hypothetical protein